jgi:rare lipoprotein A (peptidoglycan hydrolase)
MLRLLPILLVFSLIGCGGVPPEETVNPNGAPRDPYADELPEPGTPDPIEPSSPQITGGDGIHPPGGYVDADGQWYPGPMVNRGVKVGRPSYATPEQLAADAKARNEAVKKCDCKTKPGVVFEDAPSRRQSTTTGTVTERRIARRATAKKLSYRQRQQKYERLHGRADGKAAWYGLESHNRKTSNGSYRSTYTFTAAHFSLPYGTLVEVTNLYNGQKTRVTINDRTGTTKTRIMVLSQIAATDLDMIEDGLVPVRVLTITRGAGATARR